ncbi:MAG: 3-phosphoshikimate 1-carboxyvinyltransferase [Spirochaetes bacterium]|nr:3-phosphoshikimate 1-carboxyvinyltransferase [Spirochaetota bacterium]
MEATFHARNPGLGGAYAPPADKSITHRSLLLAAVAGGTSVVRQALATGDCRSTRSCLERLGILIGEAADGTLSIRGAGLRGLAEPAGVLDAGNSGTTMRLLSGMLAGLPLFAVMTGDASLAGRPMARVVEPLRAMGARIEARARGTLAPLCFLPGTGSLRPLSWDLPMASAQVKGALILAALRAEGPSLIGGRIGSRDHTERMLGAGLGLGVRVEGGRLRVEPARAVPSFEILVPGDVSSAAFFIAGSLVSGREIVVRDCGLNPTRLAFLDVVRRMGARVDTSEEGSSLGEPWGTVRVSPGRLRAASVGPDEVPGLIDEVPLLAVLGLFAEGLTEVRGADELRHKESDRLAAVIRLAAALGGRIEPLADGFRVEGPQRLAGGTVDPAGDHRIAMAAAIAGAGTETGVRVTGIECAKVSYPEFVRDFQSLGGTVA